MSASTEHEWHELAGDSDRKKHGGGKLKQCANCLCLEHQHRQTFKKTYILRNKVAVLIMPECVPVEVFEVPVAEEV